MPHVSTGDILREAVKNGSALGRKVRGSPRDGRAGAGRDDGRSGRRAAGPRRCPGGLRPGRVPADAGSGRDPGRSAGETGSRTGLGVPAHRVRSERSCSRLAGRRVCPGCGTVFHVEQPAAAVGRGLRRVRSALVQRQDDTEEVIRERLDVYRGADAADRREPTRSAGLLREIDGAGEPDAGVRPAADRAGRYVVSHGAEVAGRDRDHGSGQPDPPRDPGRSARA